MKRTCLNCDTELMNELLEGFEAYTCPNCHRKYIFGIETNARYMQTMNERKHQLLTN